MTRNILLCLFLGAFLLAGCAKRVENPRTIVVWHWMTDRQSAFQKLAQEYQAQTGIKVIFELYAPSAIYSQKIIAAAQAHILPDIYGILDKKKRVAEFIKTGLVEDLTPEFTADDGIWEKSLFPKALATGTFRPDNVYGVPAGIYGVPIDVTDIQMIYNKTLLKKAGLTRPPKTFDEFIADTRALNRVGVSGLVSGWGELWMIDCFASNYAFNIMGEAKVMATYRGEVPYTDPDWIKVFSIFDTLRKEHALIPGIVTKANKYAEQDFALGRAAFAFNGSWAVNVYEGMNPHLKYGVMLPPPINPHRPMSIWGGAGSTFFVNKMSPNRAKAIAFLKWLTAKKQQTYLSEATHNLPANREASSAVSKTLAEFASAMDYSTHPDIWPVNEDPQVSEAFDRGIQSILIGEKTPAQVAREVEQVKQRQLRRVQQQRDR